MARTVINTSVATLEHLSLLLYGDAAVGKTRFLGDAMAYAVGQGWNAKFINVSGEDGFMSISGYGLPESMTETVDDLADLKAIAEEGPYDMLCVDSAAIISKLSVAFKTGGTRLPVMTKEKNEWSEIHLVFETSIKRLLKCARFVIMTTHAQRYENPITGEMRISPALEGKQSVEAPKWFDMVAFASASTDLKGKVRRTIQMKPMAKGTKEEPGVVTRQRLTRTIEQDLIAPEGEGVYRKFMELVESHV